MPEPVIRKTALQLETIWHDGGPTAGTPLKKAAAIAVIANPFAGAYHEDIAGFMDDLKPLGLRMAQDLIDALGGDASAIQGYGKGAIVGTNGELEHGALWHVPGGYAMREKLGEALAIVPSAKKVGGFGARIDIPIGHINAAYVRSHFDAMEVGLPDGPLPNEMVLVLVMASGPRVHARMGGLAASDIKARDGLR